MDAERKYRLVDIGADVPDAVTVGIEPGGEAAAVWWPSRGDVDADEMDFDSVAAAFTAAEAARELHGFGEVVVALADRSEWRAEWGQLIGREPIGDLRGTDLDEDEAFAIAADIEAERDA
jgi:hypothetical protein